MPLLFRVVQVQKAVADLAAFSRIVKFVAFAVRVARVCWGDAACLRRS
jgi:hypothetical protein